MKGENHNKYFISKYSCVFDDDVRLIIMKSPTKSCDLGPITTFTLKELLSMLLPFLGPLFFLLYTDELFGVIAENGLVGDCYADDTQTYISVSAANAASTVQQFTICVRRK